MSDGRVGRDAKRAGPRGTAKDRALRLLGARWRSREELRRRLRAAGFTDPEVEQALEDLERVGLVDDARFAREAVRDQATRRLAGDGAIRSALREKGVDHATAEMALAGAVDEGERARTLAVRRAARMMGLGPDAAARRLYGMLLRRGYDHSVAGEACRAALEEVFAREGPQEP
jgi:regulatory protein